MYSEYVWNIAKSLKNLDRTTAVGWWYTIKWYRSSYMYIGKRERKTVAAIQFNIYQ